MYWYYIGLFKLVWKNRRRNAGIYIITHITCKEICICFQNTSANVFILRFFLRIKVVNWFLDFIYCRKFETEGTSLFSDFISLTLEWNYTFQLYSKQSLALEICYTLKVDLAYLEWEYWLNIYWNFSLLDRPGRWFLLLLPGLFLSVS